MEAEFTSNFSSGLELQLKLWRWKTNMPSNYKSPMMDFKQATQSQAFHDGFQACHPAIGGFQSHRGGFRKLRSPWRIKISKCLKPSWPIAAICMHHTMFFILKTHFENIFEICNQDRSKRNRLKVIISKTQSRAWNMQHETVSMEITAAL